MTTETRIARAVDRLAAGVRVVGIRNYDEQRAKRNGDDRDGHLLAAAEQLEAAADQLWEALGVYD